MSPSRKTLYVGTFIHTPSLGHLEVLENAVVGVDEDGAIAFIKRGVDPEDGLLGILGNNGWDDAEVVRCEGSERGIGWFFPGFVGEFPSYWG